MRLLIDKAKQCYEGIISRDGLLVGKARADRRLLFVTSSSILAITLAFSPHADPAPGLLWVTVGVIILTAVPMVLACVLKSDIPGSAVRLFMCIFSGVIIVLDLHMRTLSDPPIWPLFVLLADFSLVLRLGTNFATGLMALAVLWLFISNTEDTYRYGMFDMPGTAGLHYRRERAAELCSCSTPPCGLTPMVGILVFVLSTFILLMDFLATRGFAEAAEKEQAAMGRTIETVEAIAELLAGYDVDTVAEMLQSAEGQLPEAMHAALRRLEHNLRAYRPYLPAILLEQHCAVKPVSPQCRVRAPGFATEEAAIVFTDIRASTAIWEAAPEAMKKGMRTHNAVIRGVISQFGGYEVKTIGDAFMVAFEEARAAVNFALAAQERLLAADWPAALLEVPICRRTEHWGGLTVRIGVNEGAVTVETNALTGRVDYFGHAVNVAARLEGVCIPGAVALPAELWARVRGVCTPAKTSPPAPIELKGVNDSLQVCHVWPASLHRRSLSQPIDDASLTSSLSASISSTSFVQSTHLYSANVCALDLGLVATSTSLISDGLEALMPLLDQSGGVLVAILGHHMFVRWNLLHAMAHAESSLRFAQRALRARVGINLSLGIATGVAVHGDVGTSTQRFVTAAGPAVEASIELHRLARTSLQRCLYSSDTAVAKGAVLDLLQDGEVCAGIGTVYQLKCDAP